MVYYKNEKRAEAKLINKKYKNIIKQKYLNGFSRDGIVHLVNEIAKRDKDTKPSKDEIRQYFKKLSKNKQFRKERRDTRKVIRYFSESSRISGDLFRRFAEPELWDIIEEEGSA